MQCTTLYGADVCSRSNRESEYDYIVVGSGAGGGVVASRLALRNNKVLLLEAGDDLGDDPLTTIPGFHSYATEDPRTSWNFFVQHYDELKEQQRDRKMTWATPEGHFHVGPYPPRGSTAKGIYYPRCSTLGGCTAHNAMITIYPSRSDWSYIANITGDSTWKPENMRLYFEKIEKCGYLPKGTSGHGFQLGWLDVNKPDPSILLNDTQLFSIGLQLGVATRKQQLTEDDINSARIERDFSERAFTIPLAQGNGKRTGSRNFIVGAAKSISQQVNSSYVFDVKTNNLATKVIFDTRGENPKAVGVEALVGKHLYATSPLYDRNRTSSIVSYFARKDVILSAGAFNTPQLLKLSGIGPKDELNHFGIPVLVDLPGVGTNLQDHLEISTTYRAEKNFTASMDCKLGKSIYDTDKCYQKWKETSGGYYSSNGFPFAMFKRTKAARNSLGSSEIEPDVLIYGGIANFTGYYPGFSDTVNTHSQWTWIVRRTHADNRAGTVTLASANPIDPPDIHFHYFDGGHTSDRIAERDLEAMAEGIEFSRTAAISATDEGQKFLHEKMPSAGIKEREHIYQYIKDEAWSHDASCTCPIGAENDPMAVLDSRFRVRGVSGLRVVDASVFPTIPGNFLAVATYMIGEKAADVIQWGK